MRDKNIFLFIVIFSVFGWISAATSSTLFFSGLPLLKSFFHPPILFGFLFTLIVPSVLYIIIRKILKNSSFDLINLDIFVLNKKGRIIFVNKQVRNSFKKFNLDIPKDIDELADKTIRDKTRFKKLFHHVLKNPIAYQDYSERFERLDDKIFKLIFVDVSKNITFISFDETERVAMIRKEEDYADLIRALPFPAGYKSANGQVRFTNTKLDKILEVEEENFSQKFKESLKTGKEIKSQVIFGKRYYEFHHIPTFSKNGIETIICFGIDKTSDVVYKNKLKHKANYQTVLYKIQRLLLFSDFNNFEQKINGVLDEILKYMKCENVYFFRKTDNSIVDSFEKKKSFTPSFSNKLNKSSLIFSKDYTGMVIDKVGHRNRSEKILSGLGVVSILDIPISTKNIDAHVGCLNFTEEHNWSEQEISFMRIISESLLSTIRRIQAEKSFIESEETFKVLTENSSMGIVIFEDNVERKNNIYYINREAEKILGYTKDQLNNLTFLDIIEEDSVKKYREIFSNRNRGILSLKNNRRIDTTFKDIKITDEIFSKHILSTFIDITEL